MPFIPNVKSGILSQECSQISSEISLGVLDYLDSRVPCLRLTFGGCGRLGGVFVAVGNAVHFLRVALRGRGFVRGFSDHLKLHVSLQLLPVGRNIGTPFSGGWRTERERLNSLVSAGSVRVQDVDEESVVLQEVVRLEATAVPDPKVREIFAVVGCEKNKRTSQNYH